MKRTTLTLLLALGAIAPLAACGGSHAPSKTANVAQGSLPAGTTFKGVWFNPVFGDMHAVPEGDTLVAKYKSQSNGVWGTINGKITGDVIKFEWTEHKTGAVGPGSTRTGKGWFKYVPAENGEQPKLKGGWGLGDDEVSGGDWDCVLQKDVPVKLDSIGGEQDHTVDTGWDADPKKPDSKGGDSKPKK